MSTTQVENKLQVANTILAQLGGRRFVAMTGANNLVGSDDSLTFRLPPCDYKLHGITHVRITLTPMDVYTMEFLKVRGTKVATVAGRTDVYGDMLRDVFTTETGLRTRL